MLGGRPSPRAPRRLGAVSDAHVHAGAVLGLGMIGRHHARLLQASSRVRFVGAVDPLGDRHGAVAGAPLHDGVDRLLASDPPAFAIVAVPTEEHVDAAVRLAGAGVHVLVEKPLGADAGAAQAIIDAVRAAGVHGAVGHVERANPALREMRRRLRAGQLGRVFHVGTERTGPFPDRIRDVGVVKDLATHDLDLVGWLGGAAVVSVAAQTQHRMGREHEDLVSAIGRLDGGQTFSCRVDWLSPRKVRRTTVLGEGGMLVADTLTADLTFYANGEITSDWAAHQALRGVSEGDVTRYALARREPLRAELDGFLDLLDGAPDPEVVTLEEGLATVRLAEAVLRSAASGETVRP